MSIIAKKNAADKTVQSAGLWKANGLKRRGGTFFFLIGAGASLFLSITLVTALYSKYQQVVYPPSLIYGTWVEYDVAPYLAEQIVINQTGVAVNGGVVDTQISFDGETLRYQHGAQERVFHFYYHNWNEMKLASEALYQPVYVKSR